MLGPQGFWKPQDSAMIKRKMNESLQGLAQVFSFCYLYTVYTLKGNLYSTTRTLAYNFQTFLFSSVITSKMPTLQFVNGIWETSKKDVKIEFQPSTIQP